MRKPKALINLMILIRLPMAPCLPMLLLIRRSSSFISMDIFAMSSSLALSQTGWASSVISLFITKTLWHLILILLSKKNPTPLTKIKVFMIQKLLIPTLKDFFSKHPLINPKTFLGDAAFDTAQLYKSLLTGDTFGDDKHFSKAYIPLNARSGLENQDYSINDDGIPCCPHDPSLQMKYEGSSKRMVYIYPEKDLRAYPGTICGTEEWDNTYKIRTVVERDINHIKENLCLAGRRTQNEKTLHADLILAGITQLITVVLADNINHHEYIRSIKPLIA